MFYAVLALATSKEVVISNHTHAVSFLDKEYVKKGIFPKEISRAFHVWFDERQTSDYGEIWEIEHTEAKTALNEAKLFVKIIESYLKQETNIK